MVNARTRVGAYTGSGSFYQAFDLGGNAAEWNETVIGVTERGQRGGGYSDTEFGLRSSTRRSDGPGFTDGSVGFRVAGSLPPAAAARPAALPKVSTSGPPTRVIKALKKQVATLKAQLAAATAVPAPFVAMVKVGNAGNAADSTTYGAVPYEYSIGKFEVTLAQYTAFLNAVAKTDTFGLYNMSLATDPNSAGITQSGSSGSFTYSVIGTGSRPVTFVSWFDAARFCNWLHNGRPTGLQTVATTENGAYPLDGATSGGLTITRNAGARFWIPSEDEWYKAAYHDPRTSANGGPTGDDFYWLYPTGSDAAPTAEVPPGGANSANFGAAVFALTPVGAFTGSVGFYGTFDQGGNVLEWNDAAISGSNRGLRGSSWLNGEFLLRSSGRFDISPVNEGSFVGFRVASP